MGVAPHTRPRAVGYEVVCNNDQYTSEPDEEQRSDPPVTQRPTKTRSSSPDKIASHYHRDGQDHSDRKNDILSLTGRRDCPSTSDKPEQRADYDDYVDSVSTPSPIPTMSQGTSAIDA